MTGGQWVAIPAEYIPSPTKRGSSPLVEASKDFGFYRNNIICMLILPKVRHYPVSVVDGAMRQWWWMYGCMDQALGQGQGISVAGAPCRRCNIKGSR